MTSGNRRLISRLLVPVLVVWFGVFPYREARAVPVVVPFLIAGLDALGNVAIADMAGASLSALLGGTIVALGITPNQADAPTLRVGTTYGASDVALSPPNAPQYVPQTSTEYKLCYLYEGGLLGWCAYGYSLQEVYDKQCRAQTGAATSVYANGACTVTSLPINPADPSAFELHSYPRCGDGTVEVTDDSGEVVSCAVEDPRLVQKDQKIDLPVTGAANVGELDDADSPDNVIPYSTYSGQGFLASGKDAAGHPQTVTVFPTSDGGSLVVIRTERTDAAGAVFVDKKVFQLTSAGGVSTGTETNVAPAGSYVDPVSGAYVIAENGQAITVNTGTGSDTGPIVFPSDYAREGEAAAAAGLVTSALDILHQDLTQARDAPSDLTLPEASQFEGAFFNGTFSGLLGWSLPSHSSQCPAATLDLSDVLGSGRVYSVDAHCGLIADHFGTLSGAMTVVWTVLALFFVLRA